MTISPPSSTHAVARAGKLLQDEAVAAENAGAERLLKAHRELHAFGRAEKAVTVDHVVVSRRDVDLHDLARNLGGERDQAVARLRRYIRS